MKNNSKIVCKFPLCVDLMILVTTVFHAPSINTHNSTKTTDKLFPGLIPVRPLKDEDNNILKQAAAYQTWQQQIGLFFQPTNSKSRR